MALGQNILNLRKKNSLSQEQLGEKIYKTSNQTPTISNEASNAFYNDFLKYVQKYGLDFNSSGSNVQLYDDADVEYVQGTWNGKHFGQEISVCFDGNHVVIKVDGKETDNCNYVIVNGSIVKDKLKEGIDKAQSEFDYELFNGVSKLAEKNYFTMVGYFLSDSYSTCDLMNFDKKE